MHKVNQKNKTKKSQKTVQASLATEHGNCSEDLLKKEPEKLSPKVVKTEPSVVKINKKCSRKDILEDYKVVIEQPGHSNNEEPEVFLPDNIVQIHGDEPPMDPMDDEVETWFDILGDTQAGPSQLAGTSLVYSPEYHKALKKKAAQEKKWEAKLSPAQRSKLYAARRQREIGKFVCPDTLPPPPKSRRKESPERVVLCPLVPGTPAVPPPRIPQKWELQKSTLDDAGPSRDEKELPPREITPPPPQEIQPLILTPSTGVILVGEGHEVDENLMVSTEFGLVSLSPSTSSSAVRSGATLQHSSPGPSTSSANREPFIFESGLEDECLQWEHSAGLLNPGSDVEEEEDCPDPHSPHRRHAGEFAVENLPTKLHEVLGSMDRQDDLALRQSCPEENMLGFTWSHDPGVFTGVRESFTGPAGPTFPIVGLSPFQIFSKIWDEDIINLTVAETNKYAANLLAHPSLPANSRIRRWVPITAQDLWTFIGIIMLQSIAPLPVEEDYWSPSLPYLKVGNFPDIMPFYRFKLIKQCLHFVDNALCASGTPSKLVKIQPVIDHLNSKFSSLYLPGQEIAIDESLMLWKGRLSFAQLIATKAAQVGIKSYELCESKTGYLWQMIIYTGKKAQDNVVAIDTDEAEPEPDSMTSRTVMQLVRPLLNRGHTLVMDSFYNSPLLTRILKAQKTDVMGTLCLNREFVPHSLRTKNKLAMRTGEVEFSQTRDMTIVMWKDTNVVSLISTYHKVEVGGKEKYGYYRYKPKVVLDYNLAMGGVDKKDQLLQAFPIERVRNPIWYKKLFRRLLNVSIHNTFVMATSTARTATMAQRQFRLRLADEIMKKFRPPKPQPPLTVADHFPVKLAKPLACKWCYKNKKRTRTVFRCELCDVALCIIDCFRDHHRSLRD